MFRTISVQHEKIIQTCDFFRTISVHFSANSGNLFFFPEHVRSLIRNLPLSLHWKIKTKQCKYGRNS